MDIDDKFKISKNLLLLGHTLFQEIEPRDSMYKVSTFLISQLRDKPFEGEVWITDAILVLLLTWHNAFFRYGIPENFHENLKNFIEKHCGLLFNSDSIPKEKAKQLFDELLEILAITTKKKRTKKSGVAVVKVLHLLNPRVFPLWDNYIAEAYLGSVDLKKFENYWKFKEIVDKQYNCFREKFENLSIPNFYKKLDELNYVFFTQRSLNAESCERLVRLLKKHSSEVSDAKEELEGLFENKKGAGENIYLEVLELATCN